MNINKIKLINKYKRFHKLFKIQAKKNIKLLLEPNIILHKIRIN